jgi:hypothetical protein
MSKAEDLLADIFESARTMFLADGKHPAVFFFLKDGEPVAMGELRGETRDERNSVLEKMAGTVADEGIDAVIIVGEGWDAPYDVAEPTTAAESPYRREYLTGGLAGRMETELWLSAEILRNGTNLALGDTERSTDRTSFFLAPIYKVWGRDLLDAHAQN